MGNSRAKIPGYVHAARRRRLAQPRVLPVSLIVLVLSLLAISLVTACDASSETTTSVTKPSTTLSASSTTTLGVSELVLVSTTLTKDSGILDVLIPAFSEAYPQHMVTVIALSSEEALKLGETGDADVLLVHSPASEEIFMANGFGVERRAVMHSDFVIVGPRDDPVGIKGTTDAAGAFTAIAGAQAEFFSRGDDPDFYTIEKGIWEAANITLSGVWYQRTDQGMAETLVLADQSGWLRAGRPGDLSLGKGVTQAVDPGAGRQGALEPIPRDNGRRCQEHAGRRRFHELGHFRRRPAGPHRSVPVREEGPAAIRTAALRSQRGRGRLGSNCLSSPDRGP